MHQLRMSPLRPFSGWTKIPSSLPDFFFFFPPLLYPKIFPRPTYHLPPPVLPTTYLPPPTYHLPTPPPLTPSPELQRPRAAVERELELWSWSGIAGVGAELLELEQDPHAHEKVRSLLLFLACLLAATQQALEPGSGACVALLCYNAASSGARLRSLRCVALLQRSKLWSLAPELAYLLACLLRLACCCNAASSGA
jgi:hypothetical protein